MIEQSWLSGLIITVLLANGAQTALIWRKLGQVESVVKRACPFGTCPIFKRATNEAAPKRMEQNA